MPETQPKKCLVRPLRATTIDVGRLRWQTAEPLSERDCHLFRGYLAQLFPEELVHNHDRADGKCRYRYPLIQFQIIYGMPMVIAVGPEAMEILQRMFSTVRELLLGGRVIPIVQKAIESDAALFGISETPRRYRWLTPWMALNDKNYPIYLAADQAEKDALLCRCLIGNLISMSKELGYEVAECLRVTHRLREERTWFAKIRNESSEGYVLGFRGVFEVNFYLPDFLGLGKSCGRGYGCTLDNTKD